MRETSSWLGDQVVVVIDGREVVFQRGVNGSKEGGGPHVDFVGSQSDHGGG